METWSSLLRLIPKIRHWVAPAGDGMTQISPLFNQNINLFSIYGRCTSNACLDGDASLGVILRFAPIEVTFLVLGGGDDLVAHEWHLKLVADKFVHTARGSANV